MHLDFLAWKLKQCLGRYLKLPNIKIIKVNFLSNFQYFRYKLPIIVIIINNNGIYNGLDNETFRQIQASGEPTQV